LTKYIRHFILDILDKGVKHLSNKKTHKSSQMNIEEQIIDHANSLFDVVGVNQMPNNDRLILLGLESTQQRNLDDFGHVNGKFYLYGFSTFIQPKLKSLLDFIKNKGFSGEPIGRYGYPLKGEVSLKEQAIATGLGKRGKNTIILNPEHGTRLRFTTIRTDAPLDSTASPLLNENENPFCNGCSICIDVCPTSALEPYRMPDALLCLSNISPVTEEGRSILCDKCLIMCPANHD